MKDENDRLLDAAAPLPADPYPAAQIALHGRALAARHRVGSGTGVARLRERLAANAGVIATARAGLSRAATAGVRLPAAAEALLDHHYLIEDQVRLAREGLSGLRARDLPCLADGAGRPRVYQLAQELVVHDDGHLAPDSLTNFIAAYQEGLPLALGELRAMPLMLRLVLLDRLRRLAVRQADTCRQRALAGDWAGRLAEQADRRPGDLVLLVADLARGVPAMGDGFVAELARRLQDYGKPLDQALHWIATRLADENRTIDGALQADLGRQSADQAAVAGSIDSLRRLATMDWPGFVETLSAVEHTLRRDPAGVYARMDGATRAHYRLRVEALARAGPRDEAEVAAEALALARAADAGAGADMDPRLRHVGHYLVGAGQAALEQRLHPHLGLAGLLRRSARRHPLPVYLCAAGAATILLTAAILVHAAQGGADLASLPMLALLGVFGASELALAMTGLVTARLVPPAPLPRMDVSAGIALDAPTLVVVPALLAGREQAAALCAGIEQNYLRNRDPQLRFCLLLDLADASLPEAPGDAELVQQAGAAIAALNAKYGASFLLLQRARSWSEGEGAWIGHGRRRGQLDDLHAFLRRGVRTPFALIDGDTAGLEATRYVITLDPGTTLPHDAARDLVAAMTHPLNAPMMDAAGTRVVAGHGALQPRMASSFPADAASRYERLHAGDAGIDPVPRPVSDAGQNLFGEGTFTGQGIYDLALAERLLDARPAGAQKLARALPDGACLRAGFLNDVRLDQAGPAHYGDDVARRHRAIRGAWQLAGGGLAAPLPALARWRLAGQLRRSLVAPALGLFLLLCWSQLAAPAFWSAAVLAVFLLPAALAALAALAERPHAHTLGQHLGYLPQAARVATLRALLRVAFLPHEAAYSLDAIVRGAWRGFVARCRLLEERSAHPARPGTDLESTCRAMWFAPACAVGAALLLSLANPLALFAAAPLLLLWFLSPVLAWWISLPVPAPPPAIDAGQRQFLHLLARRTWAFFEDHVTAANHWLPPDALHEQPSPRIAQQTSPTGIGLALLANVTAWDFGFVATSGLLKRSGATLDAMALLARHCGHFYQAYDSTSLAPLPPVRVSTADSGNLAAHLLTLAAGLEGLADEPVASSRVLAGIGDTLHVVEALAASAPAPLRDAIAAMRVLLAPAHWRNTDTLPGLADCLQALAAAADAIEAAIADDAIADDAAADDADAALRTWTGKLATQCQALYADLLLMAPWMRARLEYVIGADLTRIPTLRELAGFALPTRAAGSADLPAAMVAEGRANARARLENIAQLARQARDFAAMDFGLLYRPETGLLATGYTAGDLCLDDASHALLASNARLASFVAIAQGALPQSHWFALGRQLGCAGGAPLLLSSDGSLHDYLMPLLVMPSWRGTLLDRSCRAAVRAQVDVARGHGIPWGWSASACKARHRAIGVPGTGMRRGLGQDLVIAPHAAMLALMVAPAPACANLERMAALGLMGEYGMVDAIDYTPARLPPGQPFAVLPCVMAQHQGMGLLALSALLHDGPMRRRFEGDPQLRAALPLLHECMPRTRPLAPIGPEGGRPRAQDQAAAGEPAMRTVTQPDAGHPEVQLLSNGRYHVMVSTSGGGFSRWQETPAVSRALTRWQADPTTNDGGFFCYLRDLDDGQVWSTTHQPTTTPADSYEAVFPEGRAAFRRRDHGIDLHTEIVVALDDDVELRRTRIVNTSDRVRRIELTSYCDVVLAPPAEEAAHPACSQLFVQTDILPDRGAILCTSRPRTADESTPCMLHLMVVHGAASAPSFETSRAAFLGRGQRSALPQALLRRDPLDGAEGTVPDPVAAIRRSVTLAPGQDIVVDLVLGVAASREGALGLVDKYRDRGASERVFALAWTHAQALLRQLSIGDADARLYACLAGSVLYPQAALRADPAIIARCAGGKSGLSAYGIAGELPIVLLRIGDAAGLDLARQLLQAQAWWRLKGLAVDLVIWCDDAGQGLHDQVTALAAGLPAPADGQPGGVFVQRLDGIPTADRLLLQAMARVVLSDARGSLAEQLRRAARQNATLPAALTLTQPPPQAQAQPPMPEAERDLLLDNGIGGYSADGREYLIRCGPGRPTPAPWVNVLASPLFGSVVSESGQAYSWNQNARTFRLTPWHKDAPSDRGGEAFYVRDEDSGVFWSPTALQAPSGADYLTRHGFGYSVFEHSAHGIRSELLTYVALDRPIKYTVIKLRNEGATPRRLSVTGYVEWVLGELRADCAPQVLTERDPDTGALFARNAGSEDFASRVAFFHLDAEQVASTCDRLEFIGRNRSLANPAAFERAGLSGRCGAALDPCAALQTVIVLQPGEERELVFRLGVGGRRSLDAAGLVGRHGGAAAAHEDFTRMRDWWDETLDALRIETPEPALDALTNGWLLYQSIACRLWARSSHEQSVGAYGFRDGLQDAMATVHARPELLRDHLLLFAGHQFVEGDVQHWWHPPQGRGVRTRCTDDALWLPLAAHRYVTVTGDWALLDEIVPFIEGRALDPGEAAAYGLPVQSREEASLYEHCVRAIRRALVFDAHGLPFIGSGDGNEGMDGLGTAGEGESVWMGFFLYEVLQRFAELAERCADYGFATTCRSAAQVLAHQIEEHAWDGNAYRRADHEDGTPLDPRHDTACRIDATAQSWSVLSGAADPVRARAAMAALDRHLVERQAGDACQHAAIWAAMAFARLGQAERAWELVRMLNPAVRSATLESSLRYAAEPYVMSADVHAASPLGRAGGGWSTGAAGWMLRLVLEGLLGVERRGDRLLLAPQLPADWNGFRLHYRHHGSLYRIDVRKGPDAALRVDGVAQEGSAIALVDDGMPHQVELVLAGGQDAAVPATEPQDTACK